MSNVLIGIIGVILFIGLALAGALILGDDFRSATSESKAAAVVQTLGQMAAAANMRNLKLGSPHDSASPAALVPRFLKAVPATPGGSQGYGFRAADGSPVVSPGVGISALGWPAGSVEGRSICAAIAQQNGAVLNSQGDPPVASAVPAAPVGCFRVGTQMHDVVPGVYFAYARI